MQALKALVIIMGVLIVLGTTVVVVTIYNRMTRPGSAPAPVDSTDAAPAGVTLADFGDVRVSLPEPCRVIEMVPAGERLLLRLGSVARCNRILVLDLATGRQLGSIDLSPQE